MFLFVVDNGTPPPPSIELSIIEPVAAAAGAAAAGADEETPSIVEPAAAAATAAAAGADQETTTTAFEGLLNPPRDFVLPIKKSKTDLDPKSSLIVSTKGCVVADIVVWYRSQPQYYDVAQAFDRLNSDEHMLPMENSQGSKATSVIMSYFIEEDDAVAGAGLPVSRQMIVQLVYGMNANDEHPEFYY